MVESRFVTLLRERPAADSPFEALRGAVLDAWDTLGEPIEEVVPVELHMRTYQMIESTPSLIAVHLRRSTELEEEIARVIAEREGVDVEADLRPRVTVAAFSGVMRMAGRLWGAGEDISVASIREVTESYLDQLGPVLAGKWRTE